MKQVINTSGDLLDTSSYLIPEHSNQHVLIVHGCNALGIMGAGLALQVKAKSIKAFNLYSEECSNITDRSKLLGTYTHAREPDLNLTIVNAILQLYIGTSERQVNYEAVAKVFERISNVMLEHPDREFYLAIPKNLGCGLAGGNWNIVLSIILETLKPIDNCTLYIVEWSK